MSNEYVTVRNLDTRKVGRVPRRIAEHTVLGARLTIVPDGTNDFVPLAELSPAPEKDKESNRIKEEA